ncbi:SSU ribosomal protein S20P [Alkalispirochaeta americana]|uniref:Small ribosomal subunit protein bS20 n=1 Tax=Alkalispirochaeta americana TaxID=159291 RepID=A0A1N6W3A9_9SPIO|nr:30S ribosomal protein S20 [Alkalispirochaeta americana]SIQ84540.1 SSU ribosomal protein S20P [Alkalispirochaeta americana]
MIAKGSAAKRYRQSEKRRILNKSVRSRVRTSVKRVLDAVEQNDQAAAEGALRDFAKLVDTAAGKGVYHANTAARKKSRLARKVNSLQA